MTLAIGILLGVGCFGAGLYCVADAFKRSSRIKPDTGALRVGLGALGMVMGGFIAAFAFAPL